MDAEGYPEDLGEPMQIPLWPMGVATWAIVALGALGALALAVLRLAVPIKRLGKGTRIA